MISARCCFGDVLRSFPLSVLTRTAAMSIFALFTALPKTGFIPLLTKDGSLSITHAGADVTGWIEIESEHATYSNYTLERASLASTNSSTVAAPLPH